MNRRHVLVGVLVVAGLAIGAAGVLYTGIGPAPGGGGDRERITDFPTATPDQDRVAAGTSTAAATPTPAPFALTIDGVDECGTTCRDVTVTLTNRGATEATGVRVFVRIFAGQDTTAEDALVWEGTEAVGTLESGASITTTKRVELSLQEGLAVQRNDGWITILTTVRSDRQTVTFRDSDRVT